MQRIFPDSSPCLTSLNVIDLGVDLNPVRQRIHACKLRYHRELWSIICDQGIRPEKQEDQGIRREKQEDQGITPEKQDDQSITPEKQEEGEEGEGAGNVDFDKEGEGEELVGENNQSNALWKQRQWNSRQWRPNKCKKQSDALMNNFAFPLPKGTRTLGSGTFQNSMRLGSQFGSTNNKSHNQTPMTSQMPQQMPEQMPQQTSDQMSQHVPHQMPQPSCMSQQMTQKIPQHSCMPQQMPQHSCMPQQMPQHSCMSQQMPQHTCMSQQMSQEMSQKLRQQMPQHISEQMPQRMPPQMSKQFSEQMPQLLSHQIPQQMPQEKAEQMPKKLLQQFEQPLPDTGRASLSNLEYRMVPANKYSVVGLSGTNTAISSSGNSYNCRTSSVSSRSRDHLREKLPMSTKTISAEVDHCSKESTFVPLLCGNWNCAPKSTKKESGTKTVSRNRHS